MDWEVAAGDANPLRQRTFYHTLANGGRGDLAGGVIRLLLAALLSGCATPTWYPSPTRAPGKFKPAVFDVDELPKACSENAWGCYVPEDLPSMTPGRIYILRSLHKSDRECVLEHEMKHWGGLDHDYGLADC